MEDPSLKPNLFEKGTRWDHYNELRDVFASGVEILNQLKVKSLGDRKKQLQLQLALGDMVEAAAMEAVASVAAERNEVGDGPAASCNDP